MSIPAEPSLSMRSRSSILSRASSSMDLMVAVSCGLTLQICLIIVISLQTLEAGLCYLPSFTGMELCAPHTRAVHLATCLERKVHKHRKYP